MKNTTLSRAVALALLVASGSALAITNDENNATLPFSFSNPGARSLGMGGAFLGAADDATAAYTNPAGLTRLGLDQQFSVELRHNEFDTEYPSGGSFTTAPFNADGVTFDRADNDLDEVSFVSWVLPRDNWAIALYRHQLLNYENGYRSGDIAFNSPAFPDLFIRGYQASADLEIVNWGASFAYNFGDSLSAGIGISYYDFDMNSATDRFDIGTSDVRSRQTQIGSDHDIGFNVGLLYRGSDRFSIGLSYRSAPGFDYRARSVFNNPENGEQILTNDVITEFEAPDMLGVGFSYRASDRLTINLDVNRISYSNLSDSVDDAFFSGEFAELSDPRILRGIEADSVWEQRLGAEYVIDSMKYPLSLRGGVWHEEAHKLTFVSDPDQPAFDDQVPAYANAVLFAPGDDETHVAVGFGIAFPSFQLDFAYDAADSRDIMSLSGVMRF